MIQRVRTAGLLSPKRAKSAVVFALTLAVALAARDARAIDAATCSAFYDDGQALTASGKLLAARTAYLQCGQSQCPELLRADCVKQYDALARRIPSVILSARSPDGADLVGAAIELDGARLAQTVGRAVELDPGPHKVVVTHEGARESFDFVAREGETLRSVVHTFRGATTAVKARTEPPPPGNGGSPGIPLAVYGVGALGALGFASFGFFGVRAWQDSDALHDQCAPQCSSDAESGLRTQLVAADVSLAVGVIATAAFVWLLLDSRHPPAQTARRF